MDIIFKDARGSGRTTMLVKAVNQHALDNPGARIHFWVPVATQKKRIFEMFKALEEPSICRYVHTPRAELSYSNGSDVVFLSRQQHAHMSYWDAKEMAVAFDDSEYTYLESLLPVYQNTKTRWFVVEDKYKTWLNHPNELSESYYKEATMPISGSKMGTGGYGGGSKDTYKKPKKGTHTVKVGKSSKWFSKKGK